MLDTNSGLSPEGIRASFKIRVKSRRHCMSYYNRAMSRRHLNEELYPVKFQRYVILVMNELAVKFQLILEKHPNIGICYVCVEFNRALTNKYSLS